MRLGMGEMLIILVVVLLVFGPNKLPQLGDALGKGIRSFKKASMEDEPAQPRSERPSLPAASRQERVAAATPTQNSDAHEVS
jgi:sec-independent protein translocase protein TatA